MSLGVVALDIAIVLAVIAFFNKNLRTQMRLLVSRFGLLGIFLFSTFAIIGTLYFQYFVHLNPCVLCWWQRVFMYPIPMLSFIALLKGKRLDDIADYVIALAFFGGAFSLYQHFLQILPAGSLIPCDATNDCATRLVFEFGFVTIPWMGVTTFAALALIALIGRMKSAK